MFTVVAPVNEMPPVVAVRVTPSLPVTSTVPPPSVSVSVAEIVMLSFVEIIEIPSSPVKDTISAAFNVISSSAFIVISPLIAPSASKTIPPLVVCVLNVPVPGTSISIEALISNLPAKVARLSISRVSILVKVLQIESSVE